MVHPVEHIRGSISKYLSDKCIVLGIAGSVAAYKAIDTARWLIRRGARVIPVLTRVSQELLGAKLLKWATGENPIEKLSGSVEHIDLAEECDAMLIAPATLSTISKIAYGIADSTVALIAISVVGMKKPLIIVPAMHSNMLSTLQYEHSITTLKRMGITIIPPEIAEGVAKYPDPTFVARLTAAVTLRGRDLDGSKIIVTAGASREWFDPVRFISNPSSGKMGLELALEAYARGAEVYLLYGSLLSEPPHVFKNYYCETTERFAEVMKSLTEVEKFDAIISAAALADFKPEEVKNEKIRSGANIDVRLVPTPKVLRAIVSRPKVLVGFAAETVNSYEELEKEALNKMNRYGLDLIVANFVGRKSSGFGSDYIEGLLMSREKGVSKKFRRMLKEEVSRVVIDEVASLIKGEGI